MLLQDFDKIRFYRKIIFYFSLLLFFYSLFFLSSIRKLPIICNKDFIAVCAGDEGIIKVSVENRYENQYRYKFQFISGNNKGLCYECATASKAHLTFSNDPSPAVISEPDSSFYIEIKDADTFSFRRTFTLKNVFSDASSNFFDFLAPDLMTSVTFYSVDSVQGAEIISRLS